MRSRLAFVVAALLGCGAGDAKPENTTGSGGMGGAGGGGGSAGAEPSRIADMSFSELQPWSSPIEDYLEAGLMEVGSSAFQRGIQDLSVYDGRLYLSYGDATENLGRVIPIGLRYFTGPDDPNAVNEFDTDEEQIERYRTLGDDLWAAGVDATEDAWLGNVYLRTPDTTFLKSRTLDEGVHVHDVALFAGMHWAVGSGSAQAEWEVGDIYAHLWSSSDAGTSFGIAERVHNGGNGDARWVRMLPSADQLYLFGYTSDAQFQIDNLIGATYDGSVLTMLPDEHALRWVFATETDSVTDGGIIRGIDVMADPLVNTVWHVAPDHSVAPVAGLVGKTVVDLFHHADTGETVLLTHDDDSYGATLTQWQVRILVTSDWLTFTELMAFSTATPPRSLAYWQQHLFYGTDEGQVLRAMAGAP
jgi:hypothetical protein